MNVVLVSEKSWDVSAADELNAIIDDNVIFIADKDLVTEEHHLGEAGVHYKI